MLNSTYNNNLNWVDFCTGWLRVNVLIVLLSVSFSAFVPSVLWRCWLGGRKGIRPLKKLSRGVLAWLSVWSKVQTCIWPSWCHCHSRCLASVKSRLILPFWCRLTWVVPDKGPLNGCVCVCVQLSTYTENMALPVTTRHYCSNWSISPTCLAHSSKLAAICCRLILPFWYQFIQVVLGKRPLNGCSSTVVQ